MADSGKSALKRNTAAQYALQAAKYLFPFITISYLTRVLGTDVYAVRAYVLAAMTLMMVFLDFGFLNFGTKAIAQAADVAEERRVSSAITALRAALCVVGGIVLVPITLAIPIMAAWPLFVAISYAGTCFKAFLPDFIFQGQEDMGILTYRFVACQAVCIALIVLAVHGPGDLVWVAVFEALANLLALAWSWANVVMRRGIRLVRVEGTYLRSVLSESAVFFLSTAATTLVSSFTTLFIGYFLDDPAQVSYWAIATTAIVAVQALYIPVQNSLYPYMVKRRDFALLKKILLVGMPLVAAGTAAVALLSDVIMFVLGGEGFMDGAYVIALLSPMLLFSFPAMMLGFPVLVAVGRVGQVTASSVCAAIVQVVGLVALQALGMLSIEAVCVLRCCAEAILFAFRAVCTWNLRRDLMGEERDG